MLIKARCEYLENQGQIVQDPLKRLNEQLNENDNPVIILNYLKKDRFWDSGTDLSSRNAENLIFIDHILSVRKGSNG